MRLSYFGISVNRKGGRRFSIVSSSVANVMPNWILSLSVLWRGLTWGCTLFEIGIRQIAPRLMSKLATCLHLYLDLRSLSCSVLIVDRLLFQIPSPVYMFIRSRLRLSYIVANVSYIISLLLVFGVSYWRIKAATALYERLLIYAVFDNTY